MKFLSVLASLALLVGFSSCLPDATATLAPEVVEVAEEPNTINHFTASGHELEVGHGYLFKIAENGEGWSQHHLVLTTSEVREDGDFIGVSEAITVTINAETGSDISGEYELGGGGSAIGTAAIGHYHQTLRFYQPMNYPDGYFDRGSVLVSRQGGEYIVSLSFSSSFDSWKLEGTYQGTLAEIDLTSNWPIDETLPEGANRLIYNEQEVGLNHAYLLKSGIGSNSSDDYRLYLSTNDLAPDASSLTGRSDLVLFDVDATVINRAGRFTFSTRTDDYLGKLLSQIKKGYYCKNMDFLQGTTDDDVPMERIELKVKIEGDETVIMFYGQSDSGRIAKGLYRGPLIELN